MGLFLPFIALVAAVFGALVGLLVARLAPRPVLYALWAILAVIAVLQYLQARGLEEFDRIGANVFVFVVVLPFLMGSLISGLLARRKPIPADGEQRSD